MMPVLKAQQENLKFLHGIFQGLRPDESLWACEFKDAPGQAQAAQWSGHVVTNGFADSADQNTYFCVSSLKATASGVRRRRENFSRLFCLVLDDAIEQGGIMPSWVLQTSDGSRQVGYCIDPPVESLDKAVALHKALAHAQYLAADQSGNNPVRYVRLPVGSNTKHDPPHEHQLIYCDMDCRYPLEELVAALGLTLVEDVPQAMQPIVTDTGEWEFRARKLAFDSALRTQNDPLLSRHAEIHRIGCYAARDGLPEIALEFLLSVFVEHMRQTDSKGNVTAVNWDNELRAIRDGFQTAARHGKPDLSGVDAFVQLHQAPAKPQAIPLYDAQADEPTATPMPDDLLDAPGILKDILDWGVATATKPQPHLALQSAIMAATTLLSRRYRTNTNNYPLLWQLGIALSASGKEHGKTIIEEVLASAGQEWLIAGAGYTSPGAVFSTLLDKPANITLMDEFGKLMKSNDAHGNQARADAVTLLMEVFGRAHGTLRSSSYSLMSLTKEQRKALANRFIIKPAANILALTTPATFYDSISTTAIADGFLGRFLIVESQVGRQMSRFAEPTPVPDAIRDWALAVTDRSGQGDVAETADDNGALEPPIVTVNFDSGALRRIREFEQMLISKMDELDTQRLSELLGRTQEKAMRLALVCGLCADASARTIGADIVDYAVRYVWECDSRTVESVKKFVADSPFARVKSKVLVAVRAAGVKGMTHRDLCRKISAFNALRGQEQSDILAILSKEMLIDFQTVPSQSGRGRTRQAWIALQDFDE